MSTRNSPIRHTQEWVTSFVIAQNMCPFAKGPSLNDEIRYIATGASHEDDWLAELLWECELLTESQSFSTTLWVLPNGLRDFEEYLEFFDLAEQIIEHSTFSDQIQLVSFHPRYCFEGASIDDPANATNQSPYPTIHLLRRQDVAEAIASHPDVHQIPIANAVRLRQGTASNKPS